MTIVFTAIVSLAFAGALMLTLAALGLLADRIERALQAETQKKERPAGFRPARRSALESLNREGTNLSAS